MKTMEFKKLIRSTGMLIAAILVGYLLNTSNEVEVVENTTYIYDTIIENRILEVPSKPNIVTRVEWDTIIVEDAEYKYLYYSLMDSLNTVNDYQMILKDDSVAYIDLDLQIFRNSVEGISFNYQNRKPIEINNTTVNYSGDGMYVQGMTNFNTFTTNIIIQNNNILYGVGMDTRGGFNLSIGYKVK